jgi:hypothetical protein
MRLGPGFDRLIGLAAFATVAASLCSSHAAAGGVGSETGRGGLWVPISLAFVVSVCLGEVEYSIACRERSLLEAARRIEQLFIDNYTTGRAAGSLTVGFPAGVENREQLRFLRESEYRAIEAAVAKLQHDVVPPPPAQQLRAWHDAARMEAMSGSNWSQNSAVGTHQYKIGPARHLLMHPSDS